MKKKMPATRAEARQLILQRANLHRINTHRQRWRWERRGVLPLPTLLSMRQLQLAVFACRQHLLVDGDVLELAGFRRSRRARVVAPLPLAA